MNCTYCHRDPLTDSTTVLTRLNPQGIVPAIWLCEKCIYDWLECTPEGTPHYLHSTQCENYCDYSCNHDGFDQAELLAKHLPEGWKPALTKPSDKPSPTE